MMEMVIVMVIFAVTAVILYSIIEVAVAFILLKETGKRTRKEIQKDFFKRELEKEWENKTGVYSYLRKEA